ncbi:hypothetical protein [Flavobacterium sp.]|uniref:hypothetical protein n=1 Tax=Flavobacterium sp. TaxID=239 RepID=UPI0025E6F070|nr:hypothetical protein [Flavobacterium sp.]
MKKTILLFLVFSLLNLFSSLTLVSCQKKEAKKVEEKKCIPKKKLEMYQLSEMAALMEQMYIENQRLKERITTGDTLGDFPKHFLNIYTAKFTDETDNDLYFKTKVKEFITAQQLIYSDQKNEKKHFKASIDACIACHQEKCGGPIQRIKKLYIKE